MLAAKEDLYYMAENIDSQQSIHDGAVNIGLTINATLNGAQSFVADLGVFGAMDHVIHSLGQIPTKINSFLGVGSTAADIDILGDFKKDLRPKRETKDLENMSLEELRDVLKGELEFWNALNEEVAQIK